MAALLEAEKCIRRTYRSFLGQRNEQNARTSTTEVEGTVEVHHPVLRASSGDGFLDLGPLSDEICERL